MRIHYLLIPLIWINLTACQSYSGNVVPKKGPTMEAVYDAVDPPQTDTLLQQPTQKSEPKLVVNGPESSAQKTKHAPFKKLPNPELTMYVYPHLAGNAEIPIPGYETAFPVYERDRYSVLQN